MSATTTTSWQDAINEAIDIAGGKTALMRKLNARGWDIKSHSVISQWVENGVPAPYCPDIEDLTGIRCELLCPKVKWGLVRNRRGKRRAPAARQAKAV